MSGSAARGDGPAVTRRVVHVLDVAGGRGDAPGRAGAIGAMVCAEAIAATPECRHDVVALGSAAEGAAAGLLGISPTAVVSPPLGSAALGGRSLRRALRAFGDRVLAQPWSDHAAAACAGAGYAHARIPVDLLPSVGTPVGEDRRRLRARYGLADEIPTIALLADPPWYADARRFVYMIGLLDVAGQCIAGLVGRGTAHTARARRFHAEAGVGWRMVLAEEPVGAVVHACDLAVIVPPTAHRELSESERAWVRWSILRSHLLGVPVLGGAEWLDGELCPEGSRGALAGASGSMTDLGRRLTRLAGDPAERVMVAEAVRSHAAGIASRERFAERLRRHWGVPLRDETGAVCAGVAT